MTMTPLRFMAGLGAAVLLVFICWQLLASSGVVKPKPAVNVLGGPLQTCSKPGTALTGFTRDGHCQDLGDDDSGSHHICIEMKPDFCKVTGQPNWCATTMPCMDEKAGLCRIGNWCVCQWAFASYIQKAGGCDAIVDVVCEATNMAALHAYEQSDLPDVKAALRCLQERCRLQQPDIVLAT
eukprot:TRINITY_DN16983_c0_g1_i1.p2 TRINITY_DN16983_c0_g1~~TRINITY_DN16983_c0_g1_i1.p2  ORF type:complete len:181 (-),score=32.97 TRINITY_DN16983_c0_g1_i1:250-792(-)